MPLQIQTTEDGSHTLFWEERNEHYHSVHGALQEARKVYLEGALEPAMASCRARGIPCLKVFEMGFGTALNTLLTLLEVEKNRMQTEYTVIEAFPLPEEIWSRLNYAEILPLSDKSLFERLHRQAFDGVLHRVSTYFSLRKIRGEMQRVDLGSEKFHVVYYDAFAPSVQPELWEAPIFERLRAAAASPCYLSTYCARGAFKRALRDAGFKVQNLPGPIGKREITRGIVA